MVIESATVDPVSGLALVSGQGFSGSLTVTIDSMPVRVLSATATTLVVEVPASSLAQPGTYLLNITGRSTATFVLAVGAIGPQGVQGEAGPAGADGPAGTQGAAGAKGDKGDQGLKGDKGDTGAAGLNGAPGAKGDKGDKGDAGPAGSGALRVVDAAGVELGLFAAPTSAVREINGTFVEFPVVNGTLITCESSCLMVMYADPDCTGAAYVNPTYNLVPTAIITTGQVYFAAGAAAEHTVQSWRTLGEACSNLGSAWPQQAASLGTVPLSSFGVGATFHVAR